MIEIIIIVFLVSFVTYQMTFNTLQVKHNKNADRICELLLTLIENLTKKLSEKK